jgi:hypothetical protein
MYLFIARKVKTNSRESVLGTGQNLLGSPANSHSTHCSTLIITHHHPGLVQLSSSGHSNNGFGSTAQQKGEMKLGMAVKGNTVQSKPVIHSVQTGRSVPSSLLSNDMRGSFLGGKAERGVKAITLLHLRYLLSLR